MVRRRGNKAHAIASGESKNINSNPLENVLLKTTVGCTHLEEQYFASPKRKDCKIENSASDRLTSSSIEQKVGEKVIKTHGKTKSSSGSNKARGERGGIAGRAIGVPLATRSQTRTVEHFFKVKNTANNTKHLENCEQNLETINTATSDEPLYCGGEDFIHCNDDTNSNGGQPTTPDTPIEFEEDTTDTEYSAKLSDDAVFGVDFLTHRSLLRDSHSSSGSACTNISNTENIFLQEPVLTLNVDKTPNQASSIKINTSLDAGPIFSSPTSKLTSMLNGRFNQIVSLNVLTSPDKREQLSHETPILPVVPCNTEDANIRELVPVQYNDNDNDNDNSSCDSGVAFTTSLNKDVSLEAQDDKIVYLAGGSQPRRRKPATPHRILCASPIKTLPRVISPMHAAIAVGRISTPSGRKLNKEQLSPRKSPRKMMTTNVHTKTRRRLNQQKDFGNALNDGEELAAKIMTNGYAEDMVDNNVPETLDREVFDSENLDEITITTQTNKCPSFVDDFKQQPLQKPLAIKSNAVKMQPHKSKHQNGQPLAATNNNRNLKEFFPVRRSVRKTKTAVKEEMMRTLEKAIIEEQADGLKVAFFEGKGRGVIADRHFQRGEFVVEYIGDLISMAEASEREKRYALDENAGCYMYYFKHKNQQYCIDATEDTGKFGRLVNHSRNGNLVTKVVVVKQRPHLILLAKDDIEPGEELTYDYGDRSKESLLHHPWLAF